MIPGPNILALFGFFPDDHSRVILSQVDGTPCSDYINASYIDVSGQRFPIPLAQLRHDQ